MKCSGAEGLGAASERNQSSVAAGQRACPATWSSKGPGRKQVRATLLGLCGSSDCVLFAEGWNQP